jgi:predicted alpha/beta hydrolase family esterase/isopentenyldiphosphate isomerase
MKKIYLVHCWSGTSKDGWYQWLKKHMKNNDVEVIIEDMPDTDEPKIELWVNKLDSIVDELNEDTYFIGHSIGCQTIMRYLEMKDMKKIGGILFVAPWLDLLVAALEDGGDVVATPWLNTSIDFNKVKQFTTNITAIFSDNDYFVSLDQEQEFRDKLGAKTIIVRDKGHISAEDGIDELPEILIETGNMLGFELLEEVDKNGIFTGRIIDKELMHDNNILHNEIAIFIVNSNNEILIQKRSANKRTHPNCWGLCAGHIGAYENIIDAALRELKEEVGVGATAEDLIFFDKEYKIKESNSQVVYFYCLYLDKPVSEFIIQKEELSEVKWMDYNEYKQLVLANDSSITFSNSKENINTLNELSKLINSR